MKPAKKIEKMISEINVTPDAQKDKKTLDDILDAQKKTKSSANTPPNTWRIIMNNKMTKFAAAVIIIAAVFSITIFDKSTSTAYAIEQALDQIAKAKTIMWSTTFYTHFTSKDGKRSWIETETRQLAYKSPGFYREEKLDENMQVKSVTITDTVNLKKISLNPAKKKATVRALAFANYDPDGPFVWVKKEIKGADLELVGRRDSETGQTNIFRTAFRDIANNEDWSYDFWIDAKTKDIVEVHVPGADIYDPENDPTMDNPPEEAWSTSNPISHIKHDISFDMELDESLFQLQPPEGYTIINIAREQVTEKEMIDYLGILADYYDKTFPERLFPVAVTSDRLNAIEAKPENSRTVAEQNLLETNNYYKMANLNMLPIGHFIEDHTVKNSFRYMGKGVDLGDQNRIVCWYKLKKSNTYRAVYGDLSARDIGADELPLIVEP